MRWKILDKVITSLSLSLAICKRGSTRPTSYYVEKDLLMAIILIMTFTEHWQCIHDASQPVCGVRCRRYPHFWMSKLKTLEPRARSLWWQSHAPNHFIIGLVHSGSSINARSSASHPYSLLWYWTHCVTIHAVLPSTTPHTCTRVKDHQTSVRINVTSVRTQLLSHLPLPQTLPPL